MRKFRYVARLIVFAVASACCGFLILVSLFLLTTPMVREGIIYAFKNSNFK